MMQDGAVETIAAKTGVQASDGEALRYMAIHGIGMARLAGFSVRADLEAGRLVAVLPNQIISEMEAFHAVYVGQGGPLPARMRVLLDYLAEHGRVS